MSRMMLCRGAAGVVLACLPSLVSAQAAPALTHTTGLLVGYGAEGNVVSKLPGATSSANEHVAGQGITIGYGFTRTWAVYASAGRGSFVTSRGNTTKTGSMDLGARYHLPVVARRVVPFVQGGVSNRAFSADAIDRRTGQAYSALSWGYFPALGGGANVHLTSAMAISGTSTWTATSHGLASPRLHAGVLFTPGALGR